MFLVYRLTTILTFELALWNLLALSFGVSSLILFRFTLCSSRASFELSHILQVFQRSWASCWFTRLWLFFGLVESWLYVCWNGKHLPTYSFLLSHLMYQIRLHSLQFFNGILYHSQSPLTIWSYDLLLLLWVLQYLPWLSIHN